MRPALQRLGSNNFVFTGHHHKITSVSDQLQDALPKLFHNWLVCITPQSNDVCMIWHEVPREKQTSKTFSCTSLICDSAVGHFWAGTNIKPKANPLLAFFPMSLWVSIGLVEVCLVYRVVGVCVCHMCSSWQVARLVEQERVLVGWLVGLPSGRFECCC